MESIHSLSFGSAVVKVLKSKSIKESGSMDPEVLKANEEKKGNVAPSQGSRSEIAEGLYMLSKDRRDSENFSEKSYKESPKHLTSLNTRSQMEGVNKKLEKLSILNIATAEKEEILPFLSSTPNHKQIEGNLDSELGHNDENLVSVNLSVPIGIKESEGNKVKVPEMMRNKHRTVVINVGGIDYRSKITNFSKYPASRLGKIFRAPKTEDILKLCDGYIPGSPPILFFDRNDQNFSSVLDMYRMNQLHICGQNCALVTQEDLAFWGIDEMVMEACCALKYYPHIVNCQNEIEEERLELDQLRERQEEEDFGDSCFDKFRSKMWVFLEYPESSKPAQALAFTSLFMVCISTITFVIGTNYEEPEIVNNLNTTLVEALNTTNVTVSSNDKVIKGIIDTIDNIAVLFFAVEYFLRLMFCPLKCKFISNKMNLIDLLAIAPFFFSMLLIGLEDMEIIGKAGKIIRLVRIMRIMRIFKMVRHFAGLQSLAYTLKQAYHELGLLFLLVAVAILLYTSLIFATEQEGAQAEMWSFYSCFWWGLMTLTTVGHNMTPVTFLGKLICGMCAITGIFILTLPIPIVVTSFASCYKNRLWRNEIANKKRILNKDQRPNLSTEKRNLFADMAGEGGFYIHQDFDAQEPSSVSLVTDSPTSALSLSPLVLKRRIQIVEKETSQEENSGEHSPFLQVTKFNQPDLIQNLKRRNSQRRDTVV